MISEINTRNEGIALLDRVRMMHEGNDVVVHWSEMDVPDGHISIPLLVNEQLDVLRKDYLSWIYDLGETRIRGESVRNHLKIDEDFSFWWMTLLAEKPPLKTQSIYTVFKLRAFEKFYLDSGYKKIILYSNDKVLRDVISGWCKELGHAFQWKREKKEGQFHFNLRRVYKAMPPLFQAFFVLLRRLLSRRVLLKPIRKIPSDKRQATIVTYFPNIDMQKANDGVFRSRYWEQLHEVLDKGPWNINWVWIYVNDGSCSFGKAVNFRQKFQNSEKGGNKYYFLEEFMNVATIYRAVILYFRVAFKSLRIRRFSKYFHFFRSYMDLWPAMSKDWYSSVLGPTAINGCLMIATFQSLISKLPDQEWGLYLYENKPWE
jgi:surface carbohydrate biosynthesis protein (TIGR04326 family)